MTMEERIAALEDAVAGLQEVVASLSDTADVDSSTPTLVRAGEADFWLLNGLAERHPDGMLAYAGHAALPAGPVQWQMGVDPHQLLAADWDAQVSRLVALAHPVRLRLAQLVLNGITTTADLAADAELGTTGQLHHHLRQLVAAGWLASTGRGSYQVPPQRVIPLLTIVAAAR
ncbi:MAG: helix-turn-helix domain-containing protein, partial [Propionibacteriaceae bacterium]|nr:helix-turn-helix domain-containing protein [Propionibacteriaceae bacterium]